MVDTVATTVGSLEYKQKASSRCRCSLIEQQCRCRYRLKQTIIVQLLWVAAQFPTMYSTVEYPVFDFKQQEWHV